MNAFACYRRDALVIGAGIAGPPAARALRRAACGSATTDEGTIVTEPRGLRPTNTTPPEQRDTARLSPLAWARRPPPRLPEAADQQWLVIAAEDSVRGRCLETILGNHNADSRLHTPRPARAVDPARIAEQLNETPHPPSTRAMLTPPSPAGEAANKTPRPRDDLPIAPNAAERRHLLTGIIARQVRDPLGNTAHHVGPDARLVVLGLDCLGACHLRPRGAMARRTDTPPGVIRTKPTTTVPTDWLQYHLRLPPTAVAHQPAPPESA